MKIPARYISFLFLPTILGVTSSVRSDCTSFSEQTILFKVSSPETPYTSYLFGTHHAFGESFYHSLKNVNEALLTCEVLIKENLNIPGQMAEDIINARSERTEWNKFLKQQDLDFIKDLFSSSPTDFNKMTPAELHAFLARYFNQHVCLQRSKDDSHITLDDFIGTRATQLNIELIGLETTREQIELINKDVEGMPAKVHKKRLSGIIDKIRSSDSSGCSETQWYGQLDIEYRIDEPCRNALVLTDRNNKWMGTITEYFDTNNCFVVVGLSHLMYECGLIKQLEKLGYTVAPVEVK